jgi:hypothetical protein
VLIKWNAATHIHGISKTICPCYLSFTRDIQPDEFRLGYISSHSITNVELEIKILDFI